MGESVYKQWAPLVLLLCVLGRSGNADPCSYFQLSNSQKDVISKIEPMRKHHLDQEGVERELETAAKNLKDSLDDRWQPISEAKRLKSLVGRLVTSVQFREPTGSSESPRGKVEVVSGKVFRVDIDRTVEGNPEVFLRLITPEGFRTLALHDSRETHSYRPKEIPILGPLASSLKANSQALLLSLGSYLKEVRDNRARLFFAPRDLDAEKERWGGGFLYWETADHMPLYWVFHPIQSMLYLGQKLMRKTVVSEAGSNTKEERFAAFSFGDGFQHLWRLTNSGVIHLAAGRKGFYERPRELAVPWNLGLGTLAFIFAYGWMDEEYNETVAEWKRAAVRKHKDRWLERAQNDPFYARVRHRLEAGGKDHHDEEIAAAEEVFLRTEAAETYYFYMDEVFDGEDVLASNEILLNDPYTRILFPAVRALREEGPREEPGIRLNDGAKAAPISDDQFLALMEGNHKLGRKRAFIQVLFDSDRLGRMLSVKDYRGQLSLLNEFEEFQKNPYHRNLFGKFREGIITRDRLTYLLLESVRWEEKFHRFQVVGATREENGVPVTIEDFQQLRLANLNENWGQVEELAQPDVFPHTEFDNRYLLDTYAQDMVTLHVLRRMNPYLRRLRFMSGYVRAFKKGRIKNLVKSSTLKKAHVVTQSGKVKSNIVKQGFVGQTLDVAGKGLVLFDVGTRAEGLLNVEKRVLQTGTFRPYDKPAEDLADSDGLRIDAAMKSLSLHIGE